LAWADGLGDVYARVEGRWQCMDEVKVRRRYLVLEILANGLASVG